MIYKITGYKNGIPPKHFGTFISNSKVRATSDKCQFSLSVTPFFWGVETCDDWCTIPGAKNELKVEKNILEHCHCIKYKLRR